MNLNQRSLVAYDGASAPVFDRVLGQLTHERLLGGMRRAASWPGPATPRITPGPSRTRAPGRRSRSGCATCTGSSTCAASCTSRCATCARRWRSCSPPAGTARRSTSYTARATPRRSCRASTSTAGWATPDTADRLLRLAPRTRRRGRSRARARPQARRHRPHRGPWHDDDRPARRLRHGTALSGSSRGSGRASPRHLEKPACRPVPRGGTAPVLLRVRRRQAGAVPPSRSDPRSGSLSWLASPDELDAETCPRWSTAINRGEGLPTRP